MYKKKNIYIYTHPPTLSCSSWIWVRHIQCEAEEQIHDQIMTFTLLLRVLLGLNSGLNYSSVIRRYRPRDSPAATVLTVLEMEVCVEGSYQ